MKNQTITVEQISIREQIKQLDEEKKKLTAQLPKVEPTPDKLERKEIVSLAMDELCTLSKTSKAVIRILRNDPQRVKKTLTTKQVDKFVESRVSILLKSPSLVIKTMTEKQRTKFVTDGHRISPAQYLAAIRSACCLSDKVFKARQTAK